MTRWQAPTNAFANVYGGNPMLMITSPQMRKQLIALFDAQTIDGVVFHLNKEEGMNLLFEVETDKSDEEVEKVAKAAIKKTEYGSTIFFRVTTKK